MDSSEESTQRAGYNPPTSSAEVKVTQRNKILQGSHTPEKVRKKKALCELLDFKRRKFQYVFFVLSLLFTVLFIVFH